MNTGLVTVKGERTMKKCSVVSNIFPFINAKFWLFRDWPVNLTNEGISSFNLRIFEGVTFHNEASSDFCALKSNKDLLSSILGIIGLGFVSAA